MVGRLEGKVAGGGHGFGLRIVEQKVCGGEGNFGSVVSGSGSEVVGVSAKEQKSESIIWDKTDPGSL